jgi:hypothetical protein
MMNSKKVGGILLLVSAVFGGAIFFRRQSPQSLSDSGAPGAGATVKQAASAPAVQAPGGATGAAVSKPDPFKAFKGWMAAYEETTDPVRRASLKEKGIELANERRTALAAMIQSNPRLALDQTIPLADRAKLPAEVTGLLEQRISGRGDFNVFGSIALPGTTSSRPPITRQVVMSGKTYDAYVYGAKTRNLTRNRRR